MADMQNEVAKLAHRIHSIIVKKHRLDSACYLLTFFIYKYCKEVIGADTKVIIGWVNDGTWEGVGSHAWIEYNGKKIDVSLSVTGDENVNPTGDAIVLDEVIERGSVSHKYYYNVPSSAEYVYTELKRTASREMLHFLSAKEQEHNMMKEIAKSDALVNQFLDNAPPSRGYEALKSLIENG